MEKTDKLTSEHFTMAETIIYLEKLRFEIISLDKQLKEKANEYHTVMLQKFGIQPGKDIDYLNIVKLIKIFSDEARYMVETR